MKYLIGLLLIAGTMYTAPVAAADTKDVIGGVVGGIILGEIINKKSNHGHGHGHGHYHPQPITVYGPNGEVYTIIDPNRTQTRRRYRTRDHYDACNKHFPCSNQKSGYGTCVEIIERIIVK